MKNLFSYFILFLVLAQGMLAQDLISAKELAGIMKDKNVKIVSTRKASDYAKVHITGAINFDHHLLYKAGPVKSVIKTPAEMAKILGSKGISNTNKIVIYGTGSGKASGRLYWILKYLGCKDVKILDGHLTSWRAARKPVTKARPAVKPVTFTAAPVASYLASTKYVKANLKNPKVVIVDNRSKDEYSGVKGETTKKGHIPGAVFFEFKNVINPTTKKIKTKEELEKIFKSAGITPDKEIILYCESSVRSGIVFLVLKSILKYPKVRVYDGAFYEWAAGGNTIVK